MSVRTFQQLMAFDKATCRKHQCFRRRLHPREMPASAAAHLPADHRQILVNMVGDGIRVRRSIPGVT